MNGFNYCLPPEEPARVHSTRLETFKDGVKCTSEVYTEEATYLCYINGKPKVMTKRYTEFRHNIKDPEDKTVIPWHWLEDYSQEDCTLFVRARRLDIAEN